MNEVEIRVARDDELPDFAALREQGYAIPAGRREQWAETMIASGCNERLLGAYRDGRLVGMLNVLAFAQWFGGRAVPMGGVASVVVAPEERGLGIAPQMLARAVDLMKERGELISTLGPATSWVYRKCGWEHGGLYGVATVRTSELAALAAGAARERRAVAADRAGIVAVYDRAAPLRPGHLVRPYWLWNDRLADIPGRYAYVVERDGHIEGYVTYSESAATRGYTMWVDDLVAVDAEAERTLWRHLGAHAAQAERVTVAGVPLDTLALLLPEQTIRPVGQQIWMTRIVDAAGAIAQRGYPPGVHADVSFRLVDRFVAANDGAWRLVVDGGEGTLEPLDETREPELELSVNGLATLFTGWSTAAVLTQAGLARGLSSAVAAQLDAIFSGRSAVMCDDF